MTDDDRQAAWDSLMQRFMSIAQEPEQLLGKPNNDDSWAGAQDRERDWRLEKSEQDAASWECSIYDHLDKRARIIRWRTATHPAVHHLIVNLTPDGEVERLTLLYARAVDGSLVQVVYEESRAASLKSSAELTTDELSDQVIEDLPEPTVDELPDVSIVEEITQEVPPRMLS